MPSRYSRHSWFGEFSTKSQRENTRKMDIYAYTNLSILISNNAEERKAGREKDSALNFNPSLPQQEDYAGIRDNYFRSGEVWADIYIYIYI